MWEHLRDDSNEFTFPDKLLLYCDPSEPSFDGQNGKERTLKDFVQLPQSFGWKIQENGDRSLETGSSDIDTVTQRWLYFEVLAQVFGHLPDYQWEHFVRKDRSDVDYVNTSKLPEYLEKWLVSEKKSQARESKSRLIRIRQVLDKARAYVSQHCAVRSREDKATWEVNDLLALSFMILGETLTRALNLIQRKLGFRIEGWCSYDEHSQGWGYSKLILQRLDTDGWCAKAIHMLQALLRGNSIGLMYLYTLRDSSSKGPDHNACTATECKEMEMRRIRHKSGPTQYHHCKPDVSGSCSEMGNSGPGQPHKQSRHTNIEGFNGNIEGGKLAAIIKRGNVPLLRFHRTKRRLELVEMDQSFDKSYAIFSHVWTDGFGSLNGKNEMNLCVLTMFADLLEKVTIQRSGSKSSIPELFWIDTLAIPVEDDFTAERRKAINQMHNIYTHAKYTIVLDLSLLRVTMGSGYSNPAMKITMCKWMTRLWTLQEAVLSKNLFFCFKDRIYSMTQLEEMFADEDSELHSCIPSLARLYYGGILGEIRPKIHAEFRKNEGWNAKSDFLALVWKAAQWRSTTHPMHETLSLATMLNLDTEFFATPPISQEGTDEYRQECDDRMVELLSRFAAMSPCPIPPGMIFLPGPRLSQKGYGWAPRSWLSSHEIDSPDPLSLPDAGNTRLTISEGLEVQFPGFLLHDLGDDRRNLYMRGNFVFSTDSSLLDWYRIEPARDSTHFPEEQKFSGLDLAIIVSRFPVVDLKETALFVAIRRIFGGIRFVTILNRVWISREERPETIQLWSDKHRESSPEAMTAGERLPPSAKWCVDGSCRTDSEHRKKRKEVERTKAETHVNGQIKDDEEPGPVKRSTTMKLIAESRLGGKVRNWASRNKAPKGVAVG